MSKVDDVFSTIFSDWRITLATFVGLALLTSSTPLLALAAGLAGGYYLAVSDINVLKSVRSQVSEIASKVEESVEPIESDTNTSNKDNG